MLQTIKTIIVEQRVIFRCWDTKPNNAFALFPDFPATPTLVGCFDHTGQHGAADYTGTMRRSRKATHAEYTPLLKELEARGYKLRVVARR